MSFVTNAVRDLLEMYPGQGFTLDVLQANTGLSKHVLTPVLRELRKEGVVTRTQNGFEYVEV